MGTSRTIPFSAHAAIETVAGPAIMAAPFLFDFGQARLIVAFADRGAAPRSRHPGGGPGRAIPLSAHAGFDYLLAGAAAIGGLSSGLRRASGAQQAFWSALASPRWR